MKKGQKHTEESRKKMSNYFSGKSLTVEHKVHIKNAQLKRKEIKGYINSEEARKKISAALTGRKIPQYVRDKIRAALTGTTQSEETKIKRANSNRGKKRSLETKRKMSLASKGKPKSIEHTRKNSLVHSGDRCNWWQGGKSFEEYSMDWTRSLRISIRERDKYVCQLCNERQCDYTFDVHHIDYNKKNCNPNNLITLCRSCHMKTNTNREHWKELFNKLMFCINKT